jgi:capsular polysaccharide transport system permease protein
VVPAPVRIVMPAVGPAPHVGPAAAPAPGIVPAPTIKPVPPVGPAPAAVKPALAVERPRRMRPRHMALVVSFVALVLLPTAVSAWYLWFKAADQYASLVSFSVRQEQTPSAMSLLGSISGISGSSSSDTDIIYDYITSQQLVAEIDADLNVSERWSPANGDFIYGYDADGTIEDLTDYWQGMVKVYYDSVTRLIEVRVLAFDPVDAQLISQRIFEKSTELVNRLNDISRADALIYAREELEQTEVRLSKARQAMTTFRATNQIIDPTSDLMAQSAVLQQLQQELVRTQIDLGLISDNGMNEDPRRGVLEKRIEVIERQITVERTKLGIDDKGVPGSAMVSIVAEYESLAADLAFAESAYLAARAAYDVSEAEARRRTRYLAAHVTPSRAESSRYPERGVTLAVIGVFLLLSWSILSLIYYSVRDRR